PCPLVGLIPGARCGAHHARPWRLRRGIQGQVQTHPRYRRARRHRRHLQLGLHPRAPPRADAQDLCNTARQPRPPTSAPRTSLGFHQAYYDKAFTFGMKVTSASGTSDLMSYYPGTVIDWIRRNGGLTTEMKKIKNGEELWKIVDPCPDEW